MRDRKLVNMVNWSPPPPFISSKKILFFYCPRDFALLGRGGMGDWRPEWNSCHFVKYVCSCLGESEQETSDQDRLSPSEIILSLIF